MRTGQPARHPGSAATEAFDQHRSLLFAVAYRMIGSVSDAEDLVQDAWLRWANADRSDIASPVNYLVKIVTRLALDRLRSAQVNRESYVGPWLPEPLLVEPDATERVALSESVSMAMLVVLEALSPLERAVFVLHEAFGFTHPEIAEILGREQPAVRQIARRARQHVQEGRARFEIDPTTHRRVSERFLAACAGGDMAELLGLLSPGVTLVADGGGLAKAPHKPLQGADRVAAFLIRAFADVPVGELEIRYGYLNGSAGAVAFAGREPLGTYTVSVLDGLIDAVHIVVNPDKLAHLHPDRASTGGCSCSYGDHEASRLDTPSNRNLSS